MLVKDLTSLESNLFTSYSLDIGTVDCPVSIDIKEKP